MDQMTQHNAALVEETNAAIEQTESQATELDRIVEVFVLDNAEQRSGRSSSLPQRAVVPVGGIKALQAKVRTAAKSYLNKGSTAIKQDWSEF